MNGLCPACRRTYDDKNIQWKVISPEEAKADVAAQARKKAAARQKEAERRQVETLNRKHLAGLRVVQKNLVYVVGMNITGSNDDVLQTLRGPNHFGQYGDIIKVVVSKAKNENSAGQQPLGIYVTFVNKEDAATCISVLDGQQHEGRTLRAQYGTTKYCSAYLRNEKCNNRQCMFLHETGEDGDSFSRQDLSSLNALSTQRKSDNSQNAQQHQAPPQQAPQNMAAAAQSSSAFGFKSDAMSRSDSGEGSSALPTTANWAKNPQIEQSRRSSQAASRATPSPKMTPAKPILQRPQSRAARASPAPEESKSKAKEDTASSTSAEVPPSLPETRPTARSEMELRFERLLKKMSDYSWDWSLNRDLYDTDTLSFIDNFPPLVDPNGGAIRLALKAQQEQERVKNEEELSAPAMTVADDEDNLTGGSLQLGGEPDTLESSNNRHQANIPTTAAPGFDTSTSAIGNEFAAMAIGGRSLTPQQQQNMALLKSNPASDGFAGQTQQRGAQHQSQLSNPFQAQNQQLNPLSRHGRQSSRFTFTNEIGSTSTAIKPTASAQMLSQQSSMMQSGQQKSFGSQPALQPSLYTSSYSNIQGPPPGLKSSGTPPISGGGMFGQGHGFASAMGGSLAYGGNLGMKITNSNDDNMRDIIRGRMNGAGSLDNVKRES
jgi:CCR4-NOT transcription complex subunit 4